MDQAVILDTPLYKDHQAALEIINQLGDCRTLNEFNQVLKESVIPLLNCDAAFYTRLKGERQHQQILDDINHSSLCQHCWEHLLEIVVQNQTMDTALTGVGVMPLATEAFCYPVHKCNQCSTYSEYEHVCCAIVTLIDSPRATVALSFCLLSSQYQHFRSSDFEWLSLLRATLLQTVKAIIYKQENCNYQHMLNHLSGYSEPMAVVCADGTYIYKNDVFDRIVGQENFIELSKLIAQRSSDETSSTTAYDFYVLPLGQRSYEVRLIPIKDTTSDSKILFMLRFTRVTNKHGLIDRKLEKAGLTGRELEITALIYQGISTHSISDQLCLSYHTVRNHIKHIYGKTGVSTRSELLTLGE